MDAAYASDARRPPSSDRKDSSQRDYEKYEKDPNESGDNGKPGRKKRKNHRGKGKKGKAETGTQEEVRGFSADNGRGSSRLDLVRESVEETREIKEWPEHRKDVQNAYYEGCEFTPLSFVSDKGNIMHGTKSMTKKELKRTYKLRNNERPEYLQNIDNYKRYLNIAEMRENFLKGDYKTKEDVRKYLDGMYLHARRENMDRWESLEPNKIKVMKAPNPDYDCGSYVFTEGRGGYFDLQRHWPTIKEDNGFERVAVCRFYDPKIQELEKDVSRLAKKDDPVFFNDPSGTTHHQGYFSHADSQTGEMYVISKLGSLGVIRHPIAATRFFYPETVSWEVYHSDRPGNRKLTLLETAPKENLDPSIGQTYREYRESTRPERGFAEGSMGQSAYNSAISKEGFAGSGFGQGAGSTGLEEDFGRSNLGLSVYGSEDFGQRAYNSALSQEGFAGGNMEQPTYSSATRSEGSFDESIHEYMKSRGLLDD